MTLDGKYMRRVKISINRQIIEQVNSFKDLGYHVMAYKMNMDIAENIKKI